MAFANDFSSLQAAQERIDAQTAENYFAATHAGQSQQEIDAHNRLADDNSNQFWSTFADKQKEGDENRALKLTDQQLKGDENNRMSKYYDSLAENSKATGSREADKLQLEHDKFDFTKSQNEGATDNTGDALALEFGQKYQLRNDAQDAYDSAKQDQADLLKLASGMPVQAILNNRGQPVEFQGSDAKIVSGLNQRLAATNSALSSAMKDKLDADRAFNANHTNVLKNGFSVDEENGVLKHRKTGNEYPFLDNGMMSADEFWAGPPADAQASAARPPETQTPDSYFSTAPTPDSFQPVNGDLRAIKELPPTPVPPTPSQAAFQAASASPLITDDQFAAALKTMTPQQSAAVTRTAREAIARQLGIKEADFNEPSYGEDRGTGFGLMFRDLVQRPLGSIIRDTDGTRAFFDPSPEQQVANHLPQIEKQLTPEQKSIAYAEALSVAHQVPRGYFANGAHIGNNPDATDLPTFTPNQYFGAQHPPDQQPPVQAARPAIQPQQPQQQGPEVAAAYAAIQRGKSKIAVRQMFKQTYGYDLP